MIMFVCQNFGVHDIHGQIPKSIYQVSYLLPSDFPKNFSKSLFLFKYNERLLIWQKLMLKFHSKKIHILTPRIYFKRHTF